MAHWPRSAPIQRAFLSMPLQGFEDPQAQETGVALYERLARMMSGWPVFEREFPVFARIHRDIVTRFGGLPHRNPVLGRKNTAE